MPEPAWCPLHDPVRSQAVSSLAQVYLGFPKSPLPEPVSFSTKRSFEIGRYESCLRQTPLLAHADGVRLPRPGLRKGMGGFPPCTPPAGPVTVTGAQQVALTPSRWQAPTDPSRCPSLCCRGVQMLETGHQAGFQRSPPLLFAAGIYTCVCPAAPGPVPALCQGLVQVLGYSSEPNEARLVELYWGQLDSR